MEITYHNKKTMELCEDFKKATRELGKDVAIKLHNLMNAIEAFSNLYSLKGFPQYRLHPLVGNRDGQYSFVIDKRSKWRLIVCPLDNEGTPLKDRSNEKDMLTNAVRIEIMEVSEHYD